MSLARVVDEADARQLPALIAEWEATTDERRWIARALRIDLALLHARPELVVPCLHRRCAWVGAALEAGFYRSRPAVPDEAAALRLAIAAWTRAWSPGKSWWRSVRPPVVPLDAGVVEEYRTSVEGEPWFSRDGAVIGAGDVAWERATGRAIAAAQVGRAAPRCEIVYPERGGTGRLACDGRIVPLALRHDDALLAVVELDARRAIVNTTEDVYGMTDYWHYLVDLDTGAIAWDGAGTLSAIVAVPDGLVASTDAGLVLRDPATGAERARWTGLRIDALAAAPDGTLATRAGEVIRVWDRAAMPAALPEPLARGAVQLSPDDTRALCGDLLVDARDGGRIALLATTGRGSWLEGGPPANAWQLRDHVFAQVMPFGLTVWDTLDGRQIVDDRERGASTGDGVAIDRGGRFFAHATRRDPELRLYALRGGEQLWRWRGEVASGERLARKLGFTIDGANLWWEDTDGKRWSVTTAPPHDRRRLHTELPHEPASDRAVVVDGLVEIGGAVALVDDREALVSRDRRVIVSAGCHAVRAG